MKKPNHSNDNSGQNYDPATGKYISDSDAVKPNLVDEAILESPGIKGDFSSSNWGELLASASKETTTAEKQFGETEEERKITDAMSVILKTENDKKEFLERLNSLPEKMKNAYKDVILGHDNVRPLQFVLEKGNKNDWKGEAYYVPAAHEVHFSSSYISKYGPRLQYSIYPAWSVVFHEIAHAVDHTMYRTNLGGISDEGSHDRVDQDGRLIWENWPNTIYEKVKSEVTAAGGISPFVKKVSSLLEKWSQNDLEKGIPATYEEAYERRSQLIGRAAPLLDFLSAYAGGKYETVKFKNSSGNAYIDGLVRKAESEGTLDDSKKWWLESQRATLSRAREGHGRSYWKNLTMTSSSETFAELMSLAATDKEAYEEMKGIIPSAVLRFEQAFEDIEERKHRHDKR